MLARRRGGEDRLGQRAATRPDLDHGELVRSAELDPHVVEVPPEHRPEQRTDLGTRDEIALSPAGLPRGGVEPDRRVVEAPIDVIIEAELLG